MPLQPAMTELEGGAAGRQDWIHKVTLPLLTEVGNISGSLIATKWMDGQGGTPRVAVIERLRPFRDRQHRAAILVYSHQTSM